MTTPQRMSPLHMHELSLFDLPVDAHLLARRKLSLADKLLLANRECAKLRHQPAIHKLQLQQQGLHGPLSLALSAFSPAATQRGRRVWPGDGACKEACQT